MNRLINELKRIKGKEYMCVYIYINVCAYSHPYMKEESINLNERKEDCIVGFGRGQAKGK